MLKIEKVDIYGWEAATRGMRNPLNSWDKGDTGWFLVNRKDGLTVDCYDDCELIIGTNDQDLMRRLAKAGTDHRKFMRMINVTLDITAPLYWWKEFDTYKLGTVANSCSTMHKIHAKAFTLEDFSCEHLMASHEQLIPYSSNVPYIVDFKIQLEQIIASLNNARELYLETKDKKYWWQMIQLLPTSYNQKRTVQLNYEVLANIYKSRRGHKLDEWKTVIDWIEELPMSELITGKFEDNAK